MLGLTGGLVEGLEAIRTLLQDTMRGYGQFCPAAQAAEVIAERWTPLVIRELLSGSHRFNEIQRGVPLMSPALLTKQLKKPRSPGPIELATYTADQGYR